MSTKIGLALVGAGGIGQVWATAIKAVSGIELRAVVDINQTRAQKICDQFSNCHAHDRVAAILFDQKIQVVLVATPHNLLAPLSHQFLAAGKNVLSEKPGGISIQEISRNITLARRKKLLYSLSFNHRFHAGLLQAKAIVKSGKIGPLQFIRARYGFGGRPGYKKEWRFKKTISGGGELLDQGVHMIDLARWFLGDFVNVKGFIEDLFWHGGVEDNAFLILRTRQHQVASIHVSWSNWNWIHSFEIFGAKGYCQVEGLDQRYRGPERLIVGICDPDGIRPPREKVYVFSQEQKHTSLARSLQNFVQALKKKNKLLVTAADGCAALKIVQKVYEDK